MSYDLCIRNAENPLQTTNWDALQSFLTQMQNMKPLGPRQFQYDDGVYMPTFNLDYVDEEGDSLLYDPETFEELAENDERIQGKVNLITLAVPASADLMEIMMASTQISDHLGWKVFDHQTGEYFAFEE